VNLRDVLRINNDLFTLALLSTAPLKLFHYTDINSLKDNGLKRCFSVGVFDGLHKGHEFLLSELIKVAKNKNFVPCIWTFGNHIPKPNFERMMPEAQLLKTLEEQGVQEVHRMDFQKDIASLSAREFIYDILITRLGAKELVLGQDAKMGKGRKSDISNISIICDELSLPLHTIQMQGITERHWSSSSMRAWIKLGDFEQYKQNTGKDYCIGSLVKKDQGKASGMGFPTANLMMDGICTPPDGVYAVVATLENGESHPAMAYIGKRPTITNGAASSQKVLEVHLFDFEADLYDQYVQVGQFKKIRNEIKFENLETLKHQLQLDKEAALELCAT
jgi:riboflavin kinase/FMN adenylyltransferase